MKSIYSIALNYCTVQKLKLWSFVSAIVIGHCPEGGQAGQLAKGVSNIADYLESAGYWHRFVLSNAHILY